MTNRRPYLSLKQGMIIVWVVGLLCILFDSDFPLDLLALYFPVRNECRLLLYYIPKFIEIKNYLTDLMKDYEIRKVMLQ